MPGNQDGVNQGGADVSSEATTLLSDDEFYRILASTRRRRLLYLLLEGDERTVDELATLLVGWSATETGTMKTNDDRERVQLLLVHADLPLLDEAGVVEYDPGSGSVRLESLDPPARDVIRASIEDEQSAE